MKPTEEYQPFDKLSRLSRNMVCSEKLDGTNSLVYITDDNRLFAGSRTRWIEPGDDNYGFATWVEKNKEALMTLGPGRHFGEWWGQGIQRHYGLKERRFSLFNTIRWCKSGQIPKEISPGKFQEVLPPCCDLVPILYEGIFSTEVCDQVLVTLSEKGSQAVPGWMQPEGIVVFHTAAQTAFKKTIEKDEMPKSLWTTDKFPNKS